MTNTAKKIPIMEMFGPTIQGEGALTGKVSYFIRTGGCPYRCTWCDQMEAVDPRLIKKHATYLEPEEILSRFLKIAGKIPQDTWVTLSGGDPLMWNALETVVTGLTLEGFKIAVETQGSYVPDWIQYIDTITCSPKPPSSGMHKKINLGVIEQYHALYGANRVVLKVVIFNEDDLDFATMIRQGFKQTPLYLSLGTPTVDEIPDDQKLKVHILKQYRWLADQVLKRPELWDTTISPQMHTLLWAREKGK